MTKTEKKAHELYPSIWQDEDGNIEKYRLRQAFMKGVEYARQQVNSVDLADVVKPKGTLCLYEAGDTTSARCIHCGREKWEHKRA